MRYAEWVLEIASQISNKQSLKQNSWGWWQQHRQNNNTNYRRQKAHMNIWNEADVCAVLLSNETSTAPSPCCLQNMADISRTNIHRFVQEETLESTEFQQKIETYRVTKVKICLIKYKDYEEIFFLPPNIGVAFLVCIPIITSWYFKFERVNFPCSEHWKCICFSLWIQAMSKHVFITSFIGCPNDLKCNRPICCWLC